MSHSLVVVLVALLGCGGSPAPETTPGPAPSPAPAASPAPTASPAPAPVNGCTVDDAERAACATRGSDWVYQADPPRSCAGVKGAEEPPRNTNCVCIERTEVDRLIKLCLSAN